MKGNIMIRMIALMIIVPIMIAHFTGQVNLLEPTWLWLTLFAGVNALQATFTGWCPVSRFLPKDPNTGACCVADTTGTCCSEPAASQTSTTSNGCCEKNVSRETQSNNGLDNKDKTTSCCNEKTTPCCSNEATSLQIKVLGTGCTTCDNTIKLINDTAKEKGVTITVIKVDDVAEIASYGVMSTPGVVINETVVHSGGMPTKQAIIEWIGQK